MNKKVSILMPAYNAAAYIEEAILSVQAQTHTNWELLIVDDGSTDDTLKIAQQFAAKDERIVVLHQSNKGGCAARNKALEQATGDFIQYLDADDKLSPQKIEVQLKNATNEDTLLLGRCQRLTTNGLIEPSSMTSLYADYEPAIMAQVAIWANHFNSFQYSSFLIPLTLAERAGHWDERLRRSQDSEYMARVLAQAKQLVYVPDAVFYYRQVLNSVSARRLSLEQMQSEAWVCDSIADSILQKIDTQEARHACEVHYTDVMTAWYPENRTIAKAMEQSMRQRGLRPNFDNRGRLFRTINQLFGWRTAVRAMKFINKYKM